MFKWYFEIFGIYYEKFALKCKEKAIIFPIKIGQYNTEQNITLS